MDQPMQAYPEGMRQAFNIENVGTPEGFLVSKVFSLAPLALAVFAILAGASAIVVGAEECGTQGHSWSPPGNTREMRRSTHFVLPSRG